MNSSNSILKLVPEFSNSDLPPPSRTSEYIGFNWNIYDHGKNADGEFYRSWLGSDGYKLEMVTMVLDYDPELPEYLKLISVAQMQKIRENRYAQIRYQKQIADLAETKPNTELEKLKNKQVLLEAKLESLNEQHSTAKINITTLVSLFFAGLTALGGIIVATPVLLSYRTFAISENIGNQVTTEADSTILDQKNSEIGVSKSFDDAEITIGNISESKHNLESKFE